MNSSDYRCDTIYIRLLNEGTDVWRPAKGEYLSDSIYRVLKIDNYDPDIEEWEFLPGTVVRCEEQVKSGTKVLVAIERG